MRRADPGLYRGWSYDRYPSDGRLRTEGPVRAGHPRGAARPAVRVHPRVVITRFDHAVIAVADLERAIEAYRALGFDVSPGGRHENRGTHNALIRFGGADYVELLGVYDRERAVESGLNGRTLAEFVRDRQGGLVGHCYATDDSEAEADRMREAGLEMVGPFEMRRKRPDGRALTWRLLVPQ